MQARSGALDELLASGKLTDLTGTTDDIQAQLDKVSNQSSVDAQLAAMKAELGASAPSGEIGAGDAGEASSS
jgi:phage shock protein A